MSKEKAIVWLQQFRNPSVLKMQWLDPETHRRKTKSTGTNDPDEAERARRDLEYELKHNLYKESSRMTWQRFRDLFETEHLAGAKENTLKSYATTFDAFEKAVNPGSLKSISARSMSIFAASQRNDGRKPSTIKARLRFMRSALRWAMNQKMLAEVPPCPVIKVPKKTPQPVPTESFERLYAKAPDDMMRAFLGCGWYAGLRISEALGLEWETTDKAPFVSFARNRIILPAGCVKGGEDQWVPLDPILRGLLERLPRTRAKVFRFVTPHGAELLRQSMGTRIKKLAKAAGVRLGMHSLRKGFGCRYAGKVSAHVLQKLMRHSDISMTMAFYVNVDAAVEDAVLGQRNAQRNGSPSPEVAGDANGDTEKVSNDADALRSITL
jgi:integrase